MTTTTPQEIEHKDNLFGVCNALGEEFGFDPLWLRLALAGSFMFAPVAIIAGYFAVGAIVLTARLIFPKPRPTAAPLVLVRAEPLPAAPVAEPVAYARAA